MKTPHKHAELIKAWADGAEIEYRDLDAPWHVRPNPSWLGSGEYRIKPEPKPDVVEYRVAKAGYFCPTQQAIGNLKLTYDGETGKLKSAEVI